MRSFRHQPDNRRSVYLNLVGSIESQLRQAFARRHERDGLSQVDLANKIGVNRSAVNRRLSGASNMTVETISDMVWGLGHCIKVDIFDPSEVKTNSFHIVPVERDLSPDCVSSVCRDDHVKLTIYHDASSTKLMPVDAGVLIEADRRNNTSISNIKIIDASKAVRGSV